MKKILVLTTAVWMFASMTWCVELTEADILSQADARIEKFRKGDAVLKLLASDEKPLQEGIDVEIRQVRHVFLFGCNIFMLGRCRTPEDNAAYEKHYADLLNYATLPFYWWNYARQKDRPDDARTDEIARWCKAHQITTKGHPLAWNWGEPPWLPDDPTQAMEAQYARISRCVRKFKDDIAIWDVVNEATHYDRPRALESAAHLTAAIREMGVGDYVRRAFIAAREANPDATLVINDYRTDAAFPENVLSELVDKNGKPLYDVIGIQSHMHGGYWGAKRTWDVCERFAKFGKPLHFTEVTLVSGPRSDSGWRTTPEGEERQARETAEFYTVLFSHPAVEAITWWDFSDQGAWQGAPAGFIRSDMTPKPVYDQLRKLIKGKWWTETRSATNGAGLARFRGFFGTYEVEVKVGDRILKGSFTFDKSSKLPIVVSVR